MFFKNKFFSREEPEVIFKPEQIVYGLTEFFKRPWFYRVWILQECVVSPEVCFVIGHEQFDIVAIFLMLSDMRELKAIAADVGVYQISAFERMWMMRNSRADCQPAPSLSIFLEWAWSAGGWAGGDESTRQDLRSAWVVR
jgi:hypothetical protein